MFKVSLSAVHALAVQSASQILEVETGRTDQFGPFKLGKVYSQEEQGLHWCDRSANVDLEVKNRGLKIRFVLNMKDSVWNRCQGWVWLEGQMYADFFALGFAVGAPDVPVGSAGWVVENHKNRIIGLNSRQRVVLPLRETRRADVTSFMSTLSRWEEVFK